LASQAAKDNLKAIETISRSLRREKNGFPLVEGGVNYSSDTGI
jgi:hypothetical protein